MENDPEDLAAGRGLDASRPSQQPLASHLDKLIGRRSWRGRRLGLAIAVFALVLIWWFVPPVWRLIDGPVTVTRWDRKSGETRATVGPGLKGWTPAKKISRHTLHAIIAAEDGKFYEHRGFDFDEIASSIETNIKRGRFARGGSTISQQVVKMAFLGREKTLLRKAREAIGTVLMESFMSKDEILEWYVNLAEFGDGVYGVERGSWHYFRTKPEALAIDQAVHLALVLPSPNAWSRGLRNRALTPFGQRRFAAILNRMRQSGYITKPQWANAISRGDFGRPLAGYASLLAAEAEKKTLCPGNPGCPDVEPEEPFDEDQPELSFPSSPSTTAEETQSGATKGDATADPGDATTGAKTEDQGDATTGADTDDQGVATSGAKPEDQGGATTGAKAADQSGSTTGAKTQTQGDSTIERGPGDQNTFSPKDEGDPASRPSSGNEGQKTPMPGPTDEGPSTSQSPMLP